MIVLREGPAGKIVDLFDTVKEFKDYVIADYIARCEELQVDYDTNAPFGDILTKYLAMIGGTFGEH